MNFFPLSLIVSGLFLIIKISNLGIRLSDTNIYYYTASEILKGKFLYKDIFFTNLPLFPYLSSIYISLLKNIDWYYMTAAIEAVFVGLIIFWFVQKKTNNGLIGFIGQLTYLGSFIVLSTSDHQTGVFITSLFAILSYILISKNKPLFSGVLISLAVLTKAYYLPLLMAFLTYYLIKNRREAFYFSVGFVITIVLVLLPFIAMAKNEFIKDVFLYSLFRLPGVNKINMLIFFVLHDPILIFLFIYAIANIKKNIPIGLVFIYSCVFIFLYKDIYYLYLNIIVPFFPLVLIDIYKNEKIRAILLNYYFLIIVLILICMSIYKYFNGYYGLQKLTNLTEILSLVKLEKPKLIYGSEEIAPAISVLTSIPLLKGAEDTNENIFISGILNAKEITKNIIKEKSLVVLKGINYPEKNIYDPVFTNIVEKELFINSCRLTKEYPVKTEGIVNRINLFLCKKPLD